MSYRVSAGLYHSQVDAATKLPFVSIKKTTLIADGLGEEDCMNLVDRIEDVFGSIISLRWINISKH